MYCSVFTGVMSKRQAYILQNLMELTQSSFSHTVLDLAMLRVTETELFLTYSELTTHIRLFYGSVLFCLMVGN